MPKIPELPATSDVQDGMFLIVDDGVTTWSATRQQVLKAGEGEGIALAGSGASVTIGADGSLMLQTSAGSWIQFTADGSVNIGSAAGKQLTIYCGNGSQLILGALGGGPYVQLENTYIELRGPVFYGDGANASVLGSVVGKIPVHLPGGVTAYLPAYDTIT